MRLNADWNQRVVIRPDDAAWSPSTDSGVERRMLDRIGNEVARATSVVRYAPNSRFGRHNHDGGEEILVLSGVFSDEWGDYPAGTYLRNPPGTSHAPFSTVGSTLFVKLWQFAADDTLQVQCSTRTASWQPGPTDSVSVLPLHKHGAAQLTVLVRWLPNGALPHHDHPGGEEIFVLEGTLHDEAGAYPAGTWIRSPKHSAHSTWAGSAGALALIKTGHVGAACLGDTLTA